ncbi:hypothetical protein LXL04_003455 [Taraxacum kok-saghyz]
MRKRRGAKYSLRIGSRIGSKPDRIGSDQGGSKKSGWNLFKTGSDLRQTGSTGDVIEPDRTYVHVYFYVADRLDQKKSIVFKSPPKNYRDAYDDVDEEFSTTVCPKNDNILPRLHPVDLKFIIFGLIVRVLLYVRRLYSANCVQKKKMFQNCLMHNLSSMEGGASISLNYIASERIIPGYGGGMSSAKAALESDTKILAFEAGRKHREDTCGIEHVGLSVLRLEIYIAVEGCVHDVFELYANKSTGLGAKC